MLTVIGYDAVAPVAIDSTPKQIPHIVILMPSCLLTINHRFKTYSILTISQKEINPAIFTSVLKAIEYKHSVNNIIEHAPLRYINMSMSASDYLRKARQCIEYINKGDIYQIQLGHEVSIDTNEEPFVLYERLRFRNPSPFMFFVETPSVALVGSSPELFLKFEEGYVQMHPLAGTMPKHQGADHCYNLKADPKEQAEHIMLVDLCRNDLGRVAEYGSVTVSSLLSVEEFPSLYHLATTITCKVRPGIDVWTAVESCFPAGTVTGCPKIRAMQIIAELETTRRGLYAGAILFSPRQNNLISALLIRSLIIQGKNVTIRSSAGIVADSNVEKEWNETLSKVHSSLVAVTSDVLF